MEWNGIGRENERIKGQLLALPLLIQQDFLQQCHRKFAQLLPSFCPAFHHLFTHPPTPGLYRTGRGSFSAIHPGEGASQLEHQLVGDGGELGFSTN